MTTASPIAKAPPQNALPSCDAMLLHPAWADLIRAQAAALLAVQSTAPRLASIFATQQRWLMAHVTLAQYFEDTRVDGKTGCKNATVIGRITRHGLATHNTAAAFLKELVKYGFMRPAGDEQGRYPAWEPTSVAMGALWQWYRVHLSTLDGLDGGSRAATIVADPSIIAIVQPRLAAGLLASNAVREPQATFSLFTWVDEGGIIMDRLIAGLDTSAMHRDCIPTNLTSVSGLAAGLNLSRTHTGRKLAAAERMGSLGWCGARGRSRMWISMDFKREYYIAQATKLTILDAAFMDLSDGG